MSSVPAAVEIRRKAFAVFAVTMMLVAAVPMLADSVRAPDGNGYIHTVTYHYITGDEGVAVDYYGVAVAEYNPEYWSGSIVGDVATDPGNWVGPETTLNGTVELKWNDYSAGSIKVTLPNLIGSWRPGRQRESQLYHHQK